MVKHIVMWKLYDEAEGKTKAENARSMKTILEGMMGKIDELKSLEVGINFNPSDRAFDIVLITDFADKNALKIYQDHPEHIKVKEMIHPLRSHVHAVDYEY